MVTSPNCIPDLPLCRVRHRHWAPPLWRGRICGRAWCRPRCPCTPPVGWRSGQSARSPGLCSWAYTPSGSGGTGSPSPLGPRSQICQWRKGQKRTHLEREGRNRESEREREREWERTGLEIARERESKAGERERRGRKREIDEDINKRSEVRKWRDRVINHYVLWVTDYWWAPCNYLV